SGGEPRLRSRGEPERRVRTRWRIFRSPFERAWHRSTKAVKGNAASSGFQLPRFYPILDTGSIQACGLSPLPAAEAALEAGVQILQYRHKEAWTQAQFDEAKAIADLCASANVLFVLNDRA